MTAGRSYRDGPLAAAVARGQRAGGNSLAALENSPPFPEDSFRTLAPLSERTRLPDAINATIMHRYRIPAFAPRATAHFRASPHTWLRRVRAHHVAPSLRAPPSRARIDPHVSTPTHGFPRDSRDLPRRSTRTETGRSLSARRASRRNALHHVVVCGGGPRALLVSSSTRRLGALNK